MLEFFNICLYYYEFNSFNDKGYKYVELINIFVLVLFFYCYCNKLYNFY